ncbi:flagellar hook assembly protein FlgD [Cypionkella sp.]|jgi:flagellar basal-body rod modification protein FlgD|uniref:flagellar hook assembly protein FlgD n=1 Tax=Cypionkella sp. TaxID=2811411 RepID=UPI002FDD8A84
MATIDPSNAAQQALFDKLGISTSTGKTTNAKLGNSNLGQDEFLKLMTTQLQNQDPFAPMDNGDFIAQMAQFSSVTGIREISTGITALSDEMKKLRVATASNLLGHSVLVPGNIARPDSNGEINGVIDLPAASSTTRVSFSDAETGEYLYQLDLGSQPSGLVGFSWTDIPPETLAKRHAIQVDVAVDIGKGQENLQPSVFARVLAASAAGTRSDDMMLDVQDYGEIATSDITKFR